MFPGGAGAYLAKKYGVSLLGSLPLHQGLARAGVSTAWQESPVAPAVKEVVDKIREKL